MTKDGETDEEGDEDDDDEDDEANVSHDITYPTVNTNLIIVSSTNTSFTLQC